jgi:quercetin dioxygenase-like cupin family protein
MKKYRVNSKINNPADFRMVETELAQSEQLAWHYHNNVADTFYVISGSMKLLIESPAEEVYLSAGQTHTIEPRRPHSVINHGTEPMHFVLLQGFGDHDYVLVDKSITTNED